RRQRVAGPAVGPGWRRVVSRVVPARVVLATAGAAAAGAGAATAAAPGGGRRDDRAALRARREPRRRGERRRRERAPAAPAKAARAFGPRHCLTHGWTCTKGSDVAAMSVLPMIMYACAAAPLWLGPSAPAMFIAPSDALAVYVCWCCRSS